MRAVRWFAGGVIGLVVVYFLMRMLATACTGAACDVYIPISALLPVLIFTCAAVTAVLAITSSRTSWFAGLMISTVLAVLGPIVALLIFRDNPDAFVATGTILELQLALVALGYTYIRTRSASAR
jgi:ABC-type transport system involved in cytochrome c biogenesis permease subunit